MLRDLGFKKILPEEEFKELTTDYKQWDQDPLKKLRGIYNTRPKATRALLAKPKPAKKKKRKQQQSNISSFLMSPEAIAEARRAAQAAIAAAAHD